MEKSGKKSLFERYTVPVILTFTVSLFISQGRPLVFIFAWAIFLGFYLLLDFLVIQKIDKRLEK